MGQQLNKGIKRKRRNAYNKRQKEAVKAKKTTKAKKTNLNSFHNRRGGLARVRLLFFPGPGRRRVAPVRQPQKF